MFVTTNYALDALFFVGLAVYALYAGVRYIVGLGRKTIGDGRSHKGQVQTTRKDARP